MATLKQLQKQLFKELSGSEKEFLHYLISCCENIIGKQIIGVGYPKAKKEYGYTPPILQFMKMNHELKLRLKMLKAVKKP